MEKDDGLMERLLATGGDPDDPVHGVRYYNPDGPEAADALTAQAAALAQKDAELAKLQQPGGLTVNCLRLGTCSERSKLQAEIDSLRKQVVAMTGALKPLADVANIYAPEEYDDLPIWQDFTWPEVKALTIGLARAARATLAALPEGLADMVLVRRDYGFGWLAGINEIAIPPDDPCALSGKESFALRVVKHFLAAQEGK